MRMNQETAKRILEAQEQIRLDTVLTGEYRAAHGAFLEMLPQLTRLQQAVLMDYLGVCVEMHLRMLEKAIEMK